MNMILEHGLRPDILSILFDIINKYVKDKKLICFIQTYSPLLLDMFVFDDYKRRYDMIFYTDIIDKEIYRLSDKEGIEYLDCSVGKCVERDYID